MNTTTKQRRTKAEPQPPAMPLDFAGVWRWDEHPTSGEWRLQSADFTTKWYVIPKRAEDEARRWLASQPQLGGLDGQVAAIREMITAAAEMVGIGMQAHFLTQAHTAAMQIADPHLRATLLAEIASVPTQDPTWQPGPDSAGIFRRPPGSPERRLVDPRTLVDGRWQPRTSMDPIKLQELADSLAAHGVLEDLIAVVNESSELELVTGHRRKAAAIAAYLETVPVKIVETTVSQARALAIISNDDRDDLTDIERGQAYEAIIADEGISEAALARRLSRPRAYIQQRRLLARACVEVQQALVAGDISFTQARSIVLGAADSHGAQRAALKLTLDALRNGRKVSEAEAQRLAEEAVRREVKKDLLALGWQMAEEHIGGKKRAFVWGGDQRPTEWSATDLLTTVRELRRPTGMLPTAHTLTREEEQWLEMRGDYVYQQSCSPWLLVANNGVVNVLAPDEIDALITDARAALEAMRSRYAVAGWKLEGESRSNWEATSSERRVERAWSWRVVEELIGKIEIGAISVTPDRKHDAAEAWTCKRCEKTQRSHKYEWRGNGKVCIPCAKIIDEEHEAKLVATAAALATTWQSWLEQIPHDLLCSMVLGVFSAPHRAILGISNSVPVDELTKHILAMDRAVLTTAYPRLVAMQAERWNVRFVVPEKEESFHAKED